MARWVIAFSIVAHSSTDVPIARMFDVEELVGIPDDDADERPHDDSIVITPRTEEADDARP